MMTPAESRVLILDLHSRAGIESAMSLMAHGCRVDGAVIAGNPTQLRGLFAVYDQPESVPSAPFVGWLRRLDGAHQYALIIPSTERSLIALAQLSDDDPLRAKCVLPSAASLHVALDKLKTLELAAQLGIPAPKWQLVQGEISSTPVSAFPVVLKPSHSYRGDADELEAYVPEIALDPAEREEILAALGSRTTIIEQEFIPGHGVGIELLFDKGRKIWHFAHQRLHEGQPHGHMGSGSLYRESIEPPPAMLRDAERLLESLRWHGVAMVEFKVDPRGDFYLMEINGRLWGSLALPIDGGVDFPFGLWCLATGTPVPPQPRFHKRYARLMPDDLFWIIRRWRARADAQAWAEVLKLLRPLTGRESWDHFTWRDPLFNIRRSLASLRKRRRERRRRREAADRLNEARRSMSGLLREIQEGRRKIDSILVLCYGNICRSPATERFLKQELPELQILSAGFHPKKGRRVPLNMLRAFHRLGEALPDGHRSCRVSEDMVKSADLILVMDPVNLAALRKEFPQHAERAILFGNFDDVPVDTIEDPFGAPVEQALRALQQMKRCSRNLAAGLPSLQPAPRTKAPVI